MLDHVRWERGRLARRTLSNAGGTPALPGNAPPLPRVFARVMRACELRNLHLVTYENGMRLQQKLVELRQEEAIPDQLLLLEHPPVITLGRGGDVRNLVAPASALESERIRYYETTRGGDITYHGPGQLVGYPIIHLGEGNRDVRKYVTKLEEVLIRTVAHYGITAERAEGKRGIWVGSDKVAAIGVRIARWVTSHGFALNVTTNLDHFRLINPCGLHGTGVTSISQLVGREIALDEVREIVSSKFAEVFERDVVPRSESIRLVKVMMHDGQRVLLLHRRPERGNFWQPITGSIEEGEQPRDTARRELAEETGQDGDPEPIDLEQSFMIESHFLEAKHPPPIIATETAFVVEVAAGMPIRMDTAEHDDYGWFTFAEAYERIRWSDDREALEKVESRLRGLAVAQSREEDAARPRDLATAPPNS